MREQCRPGSEGRPWEGGTVLGRRGFCGAAGMLQLRHCTHTSCIVHLSKPAPPTCCTNKQTACRLTDWLCPPLTSQRHSFPPAPLCVRVACSAPSSSPFVPLCAPPPPPPPPPYRLQQVVSRVLLLYASHLASQAHTLHLVPAYLCHLRLPERRDLSTQLLTTATDTGMSQADVRGTHHS